MDEATRGTNAITSTLAKPLQKSMLGANSIDIISSFVMDSGVDCFRDTLLELRKRNIKIRLLTGTYLNITNPHAIQMLRDLCDDCIRIRFYKGTNSFHPKAYIIHRDDDSYVFVGSSNLSRSAMYDGVEWNYRLSKKENPVDFQRFVGEFEMLFGSDEHSVEVDDKVLDTYRGEWKPEIRILHKQSKGLEPNDVQCEALHSLWNTRMNGFDKALVVAATGTGKTYLAAFDSVSDKRFKKILFVAHTEDILRQAKDTFRKVRPKDSAVICSDGNRDFDSDIVFSTIQTLSRHYEEIAPDHFDYIVIDEFHHSAANSYKRVIRYFRPKFLLGLTATPERLDNKDVFSLCDYNVPYEIYLKEAIERGYLCRFSYYGIYDDVDYSKIRFVNGRYDSDELDLNLINEKRNSLIFKHYLAHQQKRTIGFCSSIKHAESVCEFFVSKGIRAKIIASSSNSQHSLERSVAIDSLAKGTTQVLFSIDMLNEGVDVPSVDMVMFLRPTESFTKFTQQLGRGLRVSDDKERLIVLDFVGNYRGVAMIPRVLSGEGHIKGAERNPSPPDGCTVDFELEVKDIIREFERKNTNTSELISSEYDRIREFIGHVPSRVELFDNMDPFVFSQVKKKANLNPFNDYLRYRLDHGCDDSIMSSFAENVAGEFINMLERTSMSRMYKLPVILSMFSKEKVVFEPSADDIVESFNEFYSRDNNIADFE